MEVVEGEGLRVGIITMAIIQINSFIFSPIQEAKRVNSALAYEKSVCWHSPDNLTFCS